MPTWDPQRRLGRDDVPEVVAASVLPPAARRDAQGVGLEVELLAVRRGPAGTTRVPLGSFDEPGTVRGTVAGIARTSGLFRDPLDPTGLADGGEVTFEPGGQVELSARCGETPATALAELQPLLDALASGFGREGIALVSVGFDPWHDVAVVPQQLSEARYPAMASYLARRSPAGALMMRHTASLQVNLDGGTGDVLRARWAVANLVAPVVTATFANSPDPARGAVSRRALLWQELDPTRTGIPVAFREGGDDPVTAIVRAALDADVLLVSHDAGASPGTPGVRFSDWLGAPHPEHGWPTADDLRSHLTTLFHEVRPRGAFELRSIDALPARWRGVPVTLLSGLLYDAQARDRVLEVLEPHRIELPGLLRRAATTGLHDPRMCALAVEVWSFALAGARRLPAGAVTPAMAEQAESFIDRFTVRGRAPADEVAEQAHLGAAAAVASLAEPDPARRAQHAGDPPSRRTQ